MFLLVCRSATTPNHNDGNTGVESADASAVAAECDIGKLLELQIDVTTLSKEDKYRIITSEPDSDASNYP